MSTRQRRDPKQSSRKQRMQPRKAKLVPVGIWEHVSSMRCSRPSRPHTSKPRGTAACSCLSTEMEYEVCSACQQGWTMRYASVLKEMITSCRRGPGEESSRSSWRLLASSTWNVFQRGVFVGHSHSGSGKAERRWSEMINRGKSWAIRAMLPATTPDSVLTNMHHQLAG